MSHQIRCVNGELSIDGHTVPHPDDMTYNIDTDVTTLAYKGMPEFITIAGGGAGDLS
jgi:hypothetical protein